MSEENHEQTELDLPWFLEEGPGQCSSCEHFYHFEALVDCVGCDGPVCTQCVAVVIETRETYCPACNEQDRKMAVGD